MLPLVMRPSSASHKPMSGAHRLTRDRGRVEGGGCGESVEDKENENPKNFNEMPVE